MSMQLLLDKRRPSLQKKLFASTDALGVWSHVDCNTEIYRRCLALLQSVVPYRYGQWLIEDQESHDYRVIASVVPENSANYATAHRTGIIGQVFRIEKPILAPDVGNHPLYDPFDDAIEWELCFPIFESGKITGVINLEGTGNPESGHGNWDRICEVVHESTQCNPPSSVPQVDTSCLVNTCRIVIRAASDQDQRSEIVNIARAIARGGESTLLVGHFPDLLRGRGPTMAEASQMGLGVSYCYFGVERRLDLLATGAVTHVATLEDPLAWWRTSRGRYAFVLVNMSDMDADLYVSGLSAHQVAAHDLTIDIIKETTS